MHQDLKRLSVKKVSRRLRVRTNHVKLARQERGAAVLRLALVSRMVFEKVVFHIKRLPDWFRRVDATLATVHHGNMAQA